MEALQHLQAGITDTELHFEPLTGLFLDMQSICETEC